MPNCSISSLPGEKKSVDFSDINAQVRIDIPLMALVQNNIHISGGIRKNLKLKGGVPSYCVARAFSDLISKHIEWSGTPTTELHSMTPAVRRD